MIFHILFTLSSFVASLSSRYYSHFSVVNYYVQGIFHANKKITFPENLNILMNYIDTYRTYLALNLRYMFFTGIYNREIYRK